MSDARVRITRVRQPWRDRYRKYVVVIDDARVGKLSNGEVATFPVSGGTHRLRLKIDWTGSDEVEFVAEPGALVEFECAASGSLVTAPGRATKRSGWIDLSRTN